ncbi:unnamed protein product [Closterium sp. NIES-65]|nr:unnamed protein product [Closterium sp. NIES-65]
MSPAKPASRLQSVGVGLLAIIAAFLLFWPGPGDVPRRRLAFKPLNKAQIFKSPFKGFSKGVQDMINKLKQRDRTMAKFVGNSVETMPISVNMTQQGVLLALKKAWGGNFYQSETWLQSAQAELWWGVTINEFGAVTALELPRAEITGPLPMLLTKLTGLTSLDLRGNHLRGSIPKGLLAALPGLQSLYLSDNNLVGEFPFNEVFRRPVVPMAMLQIDGNVFTGTIADDVFANATSLQSLGLSANKFSGAIPSSLGNCRQISAIDLSDNQFTGQIPGSIAGLPALSIFDVGQNKLSGVIPDFLGNFPNMMNLDLSNNQFYGVVPATFSKFGQTLRAVKLANNFLTGPLPQFPNLGQGCGSPGPDGSDSISCYMFSVLLDLSGNYFEGSTQLTIQVPGSEDYPGTSQVCPAEYPEKVLVEGNCLTTDGVGDAECTAEGQRLPEQCSAFCGTGTPVGQCGGNGVCVVDTSVAAAAKPKYVCKCDNGFQAPAGRKPWQNKLPMWLMLPRNLKMKKKHLSQLRSVGIQTLKDFRVL